MLDVDIQPTYVRVTLQKPEKKDKIIQLSFPAEVRPDDASAQRSQNTGELCLTCPKLHWDPSMRRSAEEGDPDYTPGMARLGKKPAGQVRFWTRGRTLRSALRV
ncbi:hypothetical protein T484DRAFT_2484252 [Baffinella frigidus]|nr:hypothetical protein T484DRAFT_2484252 [Cryptophyta sp. CCMP2293]